MLLTRVGLILSSNEDPIPAEGSSNVPVSVSDDSTYTGYTTQVHCGYYINGAYLETALAKSGSDWVIPGDIFSDNGIMALSVGLVSGSIVLKTNQVCFNIRKSPSGSVILPSTATWQELVADYIDVYIADKTGGIEALAEDLETKTDAAQETLDNVNNTLAEYSGTIEVVEQVTKNKNELEGARKSFLLDTVQDTLKERLDVDFNNILQRILGSTTVPYEDGFISASNTYLGLTDGLEVRGKTYQNLYLSDNIPSKTSNTGISGTDYTFTASHGNAEFTKIEGSEVVYNYIYFKFGNMSKMLVKPNTTYTVIGIFENISYVRFSKDDGTDILSTAPSLSENGYQKVLMTTKDYASEDVTSQRVYLRAGGIETNTTFSIQNFMILEGDYTEIDLPATITGIESVESPLVRSVGKNLLDKDIWKNDSPSMTNGSIVWEDDKITMTNTGTNCHTENGVTSVIGGEISEDNKKYLIKVKPSTVYFLKWTENIVSGTKLSSSCYLNTVNSDYKALFFSSVIGTSGKQITTGSDAEYIVFRLGFQTSTENIGTIIEFSDIQLEESSTATYYEPYTTDSIDLDGYTLRSLPDGTCDTVDEENYTQNVESNDTWSSSDITMLSSYELDNTKLFKLDDSQGDGTTDKSVFSTLPFISGITSKDATGWDSSTFSSSRVVYFRVLGIKTVSDMVEYLNDNNVEFLYPLATPIVTPIELNELKTYDGTTHIFSENSNVEPTIYARIPTDMGASVASVMSTNAALIEENEALTNAIIEQGGIQDV